MKQGDKVWIFDNYAQRIISKKVIEVGEESVIAGEFPGFVGFFRLDIDAFPTREALCEHYRKIFE